MTGSAGSSADPPRTYPRSTSRHRSGRSTASPGAGAVACWWHWSGTTTWWHQTYNGPNGTGLDLTAQPATTHPPLTAVATVPPGSRQGRIRQYGHGWSVWWQVGSTTYTLTMIPGESGRGWTLNQFEQQVTALPWA